MVARDCQPMMLWPSTSQRSGSSSLQLEWIKALHANVHRYYYWSVRGLLLIRYLFEGSFLKVAPFQPSTYTLNLWFFFLHIAFARVINNSSSVLSKPSVFRSVSSRWSPWKVVLQILSFPIVASFVNLLIGLKPLSFTSKSFFITINFCYSFLIHG